MALMALMALVAQECNEVTVSDEVEAGHGWTWLDMAGHGWTWLDSPK